MFKRVPIAIKVSAIENDFLRHTVIVVSFPFALLYSVLCAAFMLSVLIILGLMLLVVGILDLLGITHLVKTAKKVW